MKRTVLGLVGSNRRGGAATEKIYLLDSSIEFCTNCRQCTQHPGPGTGRCFLEGDMTGLVERIEGADALSSAPRTISAASTP